LANPDLGQKQICPHCQAKFYDLSRRPAVCPKCQTAFDPEEAVRNRRIRTRAPDYDAEEEKEEKVLVDEEAEGFEEEADETPEIDEAAAAEPLEADEDAEEPEGGTPAAPGEDIGVDFAEDEVEGAEDDAVPFLEDEEDEGFDEEIEGIGDDEEGEH
jgi:uncharacterized protein (TIGR02300 family)